MYEKLTKLFEKEGARFWEFREEEIKTNTIAAWNTEIKDLNIGTKKGCSLRVLHNNGWGFYYFEENKINEAVKKVIKLAKAMDNKEKRKVFLGKAIKDSKKNKTKINVEDIDLEQKKKLVIENSHIHDETIKSLQVTYNDIIRKSRYINSVGSEIEQTLIYTHGSINATAKGNRIETYDSRYGGLNGYEVTEKLSEKVEFTCKKAIAMLKTEVPKGGTYPVICDGVLTDVFVHEALGHACEGDIVMENGSCLKNMLGKKIAPSNINIYDDSSLQGEWGSFFYDEEGIKAQKTQLIKEGILNGFMHSRLTSPYFDSIPTGNSRAQAVNFIPQVRMSNTYLEKGNSNFEEMLKSVKNGFYLKGSKGGQVDTVSGNFQFNAVEGYMIKNGELKDHLRGVSLLGNTLEILKNITKISNQYEQGLIGFCGKGGQFVPAKGNCPGILISKAMIGGK